MLVFQNIKKLYDGTSPEKSSLHQSVDMWVDAGKIHKIEPHQKAMTSSDALTVVDAADKVVTPGIVDCHGHVTILGLSHSDMDRMNDQESLLFVEKILFTSLVEGGVTTLRDVGGATHFMKRMVEEGMMIGPRLKIAICMLSSTGGHADFRGPDRCHAELSKLWPEAKGRPSSVVDNPWECRKRVREIAACGADLIKICASPGVASPGDHLEHREFTPDEIEAICDEAEARGLRVAAHAHSQSGIELAIKHGVHDIQHISRMDERLVDMAHKSDCTVTPTSWIVEALVQQPDLNPFVREKALDVRESHNKAVAYAKTGGLKILAGSDPVLRGMHGRNYMEIQQLIEDGLTPLQAWHGATGLAASEIGQNDAGALREGARADFLVSNADVVEQPSKLDDALCEVFKDGEGYRGFYAEAPQRTYRSACRDIM